MTQDNETCRKSRGGHGLMWLVLGAAAGAAAAVLMAPRSGRETREKLGDWCKSARNKLRLSCGDTDEPANETAEELVEA